MISLTRNSWLRLNYAQLGDSRRTLDSIGTEWEGDKMRGLGEIKYIAM